VLVIFLSVASLIYYLCNQLKMDSYGEQISDSEKVLELRFNVNIFTFYIFLHVDQLGIANWPFQNFTPLRSDSHLKAVIVL